MRNARRFISQEKEVFLVSFSLAFLRFPCKFQGKPHSFPWFTAALAHSNHDFHLHQQSKSLHVKWNSDRLIIVAKWLLTLPNMLMLLKEAITSQKHGSNDFWRILLLILNFVNRSGLELIYKFPVSFRSSPIHLHGLQLPYLIEITSLLLFVPAE